MATSITQLQSRSETLYKLQKDIIKLKNLIEIQCYSGNYNYDPYMYGMANGMILALSVIEDKEPNYLEAPDKWLRKNAEST